MVEMKTIKVLSEDYDIPEHELPGVIKEKYQQIMALRPVEEICRLTELLFLISKQVEKK